MTNSEKLRALADWFDLYDRKNPTHQIDGNEIQKDLRAMANEFERLQLSGIVRPEGEGCDHHFVYSRNITLKDGYLCTNCGEYRAASKEGEPLPAEGEAQSGRECNHKGYWYELSKFVVCLNCGFTKK